MKESLKALREQFNYSQNTIAGFLGISRQMYIKYENGDVEPPVKTIVSLCKLYKVPYDYLIENKVISRNHNNSMPEKITYKIRESKPLQLADSGADCDSEQNCSQMIVDMFSKLTFIKQLSVFAELAGIIQKQSEKEAAGKVETKIEMVAEDLNNG